MVDKFRKELDRHRGKLTLTGVVTAASIIGAVLFSFGSGIAKLDKEIGDGATSRVDSLQAQVEWLLNHRCDCARRSRILRAPVAPAKREGVARRLWHLLF